MPAAASPSEASHSQGSHSVSIDGVLQRYHLYGDGPLCIAHAGGPGFSWQYLRMPELERHCTMVYIEPIGTGDSGRLPAGENYTLGHYVRWIDGLIDHLGGEPVFLLGHSHGGFVALRFALTHPDRLAGLILYDTSPVTGEDFFATIMEGVGSFAERHAGHPELPGILAALEDEGAATTDEELASAVRRSFPVYFRDYWSQEHKLTTLRENMTANIAPYIHGDPESFDVRDNMGTIGVPTLVVVGRHDPICGVRWAEMLHAGIPGSRLEILEQSAHFGHLEEPEAFTSAVLELVTNVRPAPAG